MILCANTAEVLQRLVEIVERVACSRDGSKSRESFALVESYVNGKETAPRSEWASTYTGTACLDDL